MAFNVDDLWQKVNETHPIALKEWVECFDEAEGDGEDKDKEHKRGDSARREIGETLENRDTRKDRSRNFLLRLISDNHNGYRNWTDDEDEDTIVKPISKLRSYCHPKSKKVRSEPRPRVQLALTFVEQMAESSECDPRFIEFLRETLSAHEREAVCTNSVLSVEDENDSESVRLTRDHQPGDGDNEMEMKQATWKRGNGLIHEAAKSGRCAIFEKLGLLTTENVNYVNNIGESALHLAAEFEHVDDVKILLDAGAEFTVCVML